jgi:serine/threonine protein kinase
MGCIQSKKIVKIGSHSSKEGSKNESNNVVVHNIRKDTTNDNDNTKNNNSKKETNVKTDDRVAHSNSQIFKAKSPKNDAQSKSIYSNKNSSYLNRSNHSENNSEKSEIYKLVIEHINDINLNNLIDKDIKFENQYKIINEENYESFFHTFKIQLINDNSSKEEFRSMIKIEKDIFGEYASDKKIAEEVSLLSHLDSKYIIKVFECFISNKRYYLITDYCQYGSLNEKLRNGNLYNENQIRYLVLQIFKAVQYLTLKNFLHIEISPEKILINNIKKDSHGNELYDIKLLDFFSPSKNNVLLDNKTSFFCYLAPEVVEQKYSPTCDIWSIGIIIFQMFFGDLPQKESKEFQEYIQTIKSTYNSCDNISNEFKDLLNKMLNKNASKRITIEECLSHPWVHKQNTDSINEEDEFNKQKADKDGKKSYKSGKNTNMDSKKMINNSENNTYKAKLLDVPLHRNSSSIDSFTNSNYNDLDKVDNNKNDKSITHDSKFNESTKERIKISDNNLEESNNTNDNKVVNKKKNNMQFKSEYAHKLNGTKRRNRNIKRISSISADKNIEQKIEKIYPPFIEKTVCYIQYYICINFYKKKETEKITKMFQELDSKKNKFLPYNKVIYASIYYKEDKKISLDSFTNYDSNNSNNDKKYELDEFINILIEEKTKYINDNFKNIFESIKQPNIDEIIKLYKDQEPIEDYQKVVVYIKDLVNTIQENPLKKNYFFNEFILLLDNSIKKLFRHLSTTDFYNKSSRTQNSRLMKRTYTKYNKKSKTPIKR